MESVENGTTPAASVSPPFPQPLETGALDALRVEVYRVRDEVQDQT